MSKTKTLLSQAAQANIANILKRVKAGKVLSDRELELLEDYEKSKAPQTDPTSPELIVPVDVVARFLEVTPMTLTNWCRMGMPKHSRGSYNLQAVFKWWLETIHNPKNMTAEEISAKERYEIAHADNEELKRDRITGKLVLKDKVAGEFAARAADLKTTMRALKFRISPLLEGLKTEKISQILGKEIDAMLDAFCRNGRYITSIPKNKPIKKASKKKAVKKK